MSFDTTVGRTGENTINILLKYVNDLFFLNRRHKYDVQKSFEKSCCIGFVDCFTRSCFYFYNSTKRKVLSLFLQKLFTSSDVKWFMQRPLHPQSKGAIDVGARSCEKAFRQVRAMWGINWGKRGLGFMSKALSAKKIFCSEGCVGYCDGRGMQSVWRKISKFSIRFSSQEGQAGKPKLCYCESIGRTNSRGPIQLQFTLRQLPSVGAFK